MNLQIRTEGSKYLRNGTKYIKRPLSPKKGKELQELIEQMQIKMVLSNGVGLAAPQVGRRERLFVVRIDDFDGVFINPYLTEKMGGESIDVESCLSVPDRAVKVPRAEGVRLQYYDKDMKFQIQEFYGFTARVIQHEYDHLEGKLITDYL